MLSISMVHSPYDTKGERSLKGLPSVPSHPERQVQQHGEVKYVPDEQSPFAEHKIGQVSSSDPLSHEDQSRNNRPNDQKLATSSLKEI
jgi:hypothetical protein